VIALTTYGRHPLSFYQSTVRGEQVLPTRSSWPLEVLTAITVAVNGYHGCAIGTLVAFDGMLRVSEMAVLRVRDVSLPHDPRRGASATGQQLESGVDGPSLPSITRTCLRLDRTKTGRNQ
jgi:hypothetical protein